MNYARHRSYIDKIDNAKSVLQSIQYPSLNNQKSIRFYVNRSWKIKIIFNKRSHNQSWISNRVTTTCSHLFLHSNDTVQRNSPLRIFGDQKSAKIQKHTKLAPLNINRDSVSYLEGELNNSIVSPHAKELAISSLNESATDQQTCHNWEKKQESKIINIPLAKQKSSGIKKTLLALLRKNQNRSQFTLKKR